MFYLQMFDRVKKINFYLFLIPISILSLASACNPNSETREKISELEGEVERAEIHHTQFVPINALTEAEEQEGWKLLFDGETTEGWRGAYKETFPEIGWIVEDGMVSVLASGGAESAHGGDIITETMYGNFELSLEFNLTEGANSGIKYFVTEKTPKLHGSAIGLEYQILGKKPEKDVHTTASLYDLISAEDIEVMPLGAWNHARIVAQGTHVEHWLNGKKVVEFERGSEEFRDLVAESKYKVHENFGEAPEGHILLQDHGDGVSFRNIKIREL